MTIATVAAGGVAASAKINEIINALNPLGVYVIDAVTDLQGQIDDINATLNPLGVAVTDLQDQIDDINEILAVDHSVIKDTGCLAGSGGVTANHFVSIRGTNMVRQGTNATAHLNFGISETTVAIGESATIITFGRAQVIAAETLVPGDRVITDNNGHARLYNDETLVSAGGITGTAHISGASISGTFSDLSGTISGSTDAHGLTGAPGPYHSSGGLEWAHVLGGYTGAVSNVADDVSVRLCNGTCTYIPGDEHYHGYGSGATDIHTLGDLAVTPETHDVTGTCSITSGSFTGTIDTDAEVDGIASVETTNLTGYNSYKVLVGATVGNLATVYVK